MEAGNRNQTIPCKRVPCAYLLFKGRSINQVPIIPITDITVGQSMSIINTAVRVPHLLAAIVALLAMAGMQPALAQVKNPIKLIRGLVLDAKTKKPVGTGKIWAYEAEGKGSTRWVNNSKVNSNTGEYQMILDPQTMYRFRLKTPGYFITDIYYCTPDDLNYQEVDTNIYLEPIPVGAQLFAGRLFDPGSAVLKPTPKLYEIEKMLKINGAVVVGITITPDVKSAPPPPPPAPAKKAKKPAKKGKKGAAVAEAPPPPPAPVQPELTDEQKKELGRQRITAIKEYMKAAGVSVTRLEWTLADPVTLSWNATALPENVAIVIKSINPDEEDDDSDSDM